MPVVDRRHISSNLGGRGDDPVQAAADEQVSSDSGVDAGDPGGVSDPTQSNRRGPDGIGGGKGEEEYIRHSRGESRL